jgi:hypothetical protein
MSYTTRSKYKSIIRHRYYQSVEDMKFHYMYSAPVMVDSEQLIWIACNLRGDHKEAQRVMENYCWNYPKH